jgi:tetratricopeptide (TPR) repeat protein
VTDQARDAIEFAKKELDLARRAKGSEHPSTLDAMSKLASAYQTGEDYRRAEEVLAVEFETRKRLFGESEYETLRAAHRLGYVLFRQRKLRRAERLQQAAFDGFMSMYGPNSEITVAAMNNLALTLGERREYRPQVEVLRQLVDACTAVWGETSYQVHDALVLLADGYRHLRDFQGALECDQRANHSRDHLDLRRIDLVVLRLNIAKDLAGLGRKADAAEALREVWELIQDLPPNDPMRVQYSGFIAQKMFRMLKRKLPDSGPIG